MTDRPTDTPANPHDSLAETVTGTPIDRASAAHPPHPSTIGDYRILSRLGAGGMGVVYEAEQRSPRRRVALKVVRGGEIIDERHVRMFQREAETLARLKHANIAGIYESGRTDDGRHFFAMELVRGQTLDVYLQQRSTASREDELNLRLGLFRKIADAVHYAHQRGVIHRDLKPSNIIVTDETLRESGSTGSNLSGIPLPEIKILDFGLARITESDAAAVTMTTEIGVIKGTLAYMSPEQTQGLAELIDIRADVYALGVVLYEMLTSRRPYDVESRNLIEALRIIREESPKSLRTSEGSPCQIDTDLETIVNKALEKDPDRRYASAAALSDDVVRYLTSQPILARPPSTLYQLRKFASRNRALVGGVLATLLVLIAGLIVSATLGVREAHARREAERVGYVANIAAAEAALNRYDTAEVKRRLAACPPDMRGWEWDHLNHRAEMSEEILRGHRHRIYGLAVSPDGSLYASGGADPDTVIRLWNPANGQSRVLEGHPLRPPDSKTTAGIRGLDFSPDSRRLASCSDDGTVRIWDVASGRMEIELRGHEGRINGVVFTPDGRELITAGMDRTVRRWDADTGEQLGVFEHDAQVWGVDVCESGAVVLSADQAGNIQVWERFTGKIRQSIDAGSRVWNVACSFEESRFAAALMDGTVRMWSMTDGTPLGIPGKHEDLVVSVTFSHDGKLLASASMDRTVRVWDARSGESLATLLGHEDTVTGVVFTPDGRTLISGSWDRTLRIWSGDPSSTTSVLARHPGAQMLHVSANGAEVYSASRTEVHTWNASRGSKIHTLSFGDVEVRDLGFAPDRDVLAAYSEGGRLRILQREEDVGWAVVTEVSLPDLVHFAFRAGTEELLLAEKLDGDRLRLWNYVTGESNPLETSSDLSVGFIRGDRMGQRALVLMKGATEELGAEAAARPRIDHPMAILDLAAGEMASIGMARHVDPLALMNTPSEAAFSPDGRRLVTTHSQDYSVRLWDPVDMSPVSLELGHTERPVATTFSHSGHLIATAGMDYTIRLWNGRAGDPLLALRSGNQSPVMGLAFTPDDRTLVSLDGEGVITAWRTRSELDRDGTRRASSP